MDLDAMRDELRSANANRAVLYYLIFDEMRKEIGEEQATEVMKRAIYRRGQDWAEPIKHLAPDRVRELGEYYMAISPGGGSMFNPEVERLDDDGFEILNTTCPLRVCPESS